MAVVRAQLWSGATAKIGGAIAALTTDVSVKHLLGPPGTVTVLVEQIDRHDWFTGGIDSVTLSQGQ